MLQYGMVGYDVVWNSVVWCCMVWYGIVRYGMVCLGMVKGPCAPGLVGFLHLSIHITERRMFLLHRHRIEEMFLVDLFSLDFTGFQWNRCAVEPHDTGHSL